MEAISANGISLFEEGSKTVGFLQIVLLDSVNVIATGQVNSLGENTVNIGGLRLFLIVIGVIVARLVGVACAVTEMRVNLIAGNKD